MNTPGEKTTAAIGKETDEHGERVTELCGLVVTPHQKYLLSITTNRRASDANFQWLTTFKPKNFVVVGRERMAWTWLSRTWWQTGPADQHLHGEEETAARLL